jgi:hypothetical protein
MSSYPDVFEIRIFICFTKYLLVTIKWILFDIVQIYIINRIPNDSDMCFL